MEGEGLFRRLICIQQGIPAGTGIVLITGFHPQVKEGDLLIVRLFRVLHFPSERICFLFHSILC